MTALLTKHGEYASKITEFFENKLRVPKQEKTLETAFPGNDRSNTVS